MGEIRVGTSGWHYKDWIGRFYPEKTSPARMLPHYLGYFDTVEVNNTFYRLPQPESVIKWRESTPDHFRFAVKGSRFLTHMLKLREAEQAIARFFERVELLEEKLDVVLFQLPPRWKKNVERLEQFIEALPRQYRYAFELREPSWLADDVYEVLRRHNAAFCIYELAGFRTENVITADFTYVRLHGPSENKYQGSYDDAVLQEWATTLRRWSRKLERVYCYFDNDQKAFAADNALTLQKMIERSGKRSAREAEQGEQRL
jgi:uncharacterized protein YecE (DUF72 family)